MKKVNKIFAVVLTLLALAIVLSACGAGGSGSGKYDVLTHIGTWKEYDTLKITGNAFTLAQSDEDSDGGINFTLSSEYKGTVTQDGDTLTLKIVTASVKYEFDSEDDRKAMLAELEMYKDYIGEDYYNQMLKALGDGFTMTAEEAATAGQAGEGYITEIVKTVNKTDKTALVISETEIDGSKTEYEYFSDAGAVKIEKFTDNEGDVETYEYDENGNDVM